MIGARSYDAIVIGAGVNGLAAATYLAMAGKQVVVVDARSSPGGMSETATLGEGSLYSKAAHALYALDPAVIRELRLARHGLKFAVRDLPTVGVRSDGKHVVLSRDSDATARQLAIHSEADAQIWPRFRREWLGLSRELRALWWQTGRDGAILADARVQRLARTSAGAWLNFWLESEALKATLGFDALALSPLAAGSSLLLFWRAAQEMCGLQAAVALPKGGFGTVAASFAGAARRAGVEIRTDAAVSDILVSTEIGVKGVALASGAIVTAPLVLSSLSRTQTCSFPSVHAGLGFDAIAALKKTKPGTSVARVTLALSAPLKLAGAPAAARFIFAERLENLVAAHVASYAGQLPQELTMEMIMPAVADSALAPAGHHLVSILVGPVPRAAAEGWRQLKPVLAAKVVAALGRHFPGTGRRLLGVEVLTPEDTHALYGAEDAFGGSLGVSHMLADWRERVRTPIDRLVLCGAGADPVGAVSGRGGRAAAAFVFEQEAKR